MSHTYAQTGDSVLQSASLQNCIQYALKHQPLLQQSLLDQEITERQIKGKLADWFPQVSLNANYQNTFQKPAFVTSNGLLKSGSYNSSAVQLGVTQTLFNRDALLAFKSAGDVRTQTRQNTSSNRIEVGANVSKAFYDVLLTQEQSGVLDEDIIRLQRSLKDATSQYKAGIVDKTDYKRATISLNNSKAQKKQNEELYKAKLIYLKSLMNYPDSTALSLVYDSAQMMQEIFIDTTQGYRYEDRIEYQLLQTQKKLQEANLLYEKWSYLPSVSLFGNYNFNYLNDQFSKLYNDNLPNSYAGVTLAFPIFQGTKRTQNIRIAELQLKRLDYDFMALKNAVSSEYSSAMASYKSNLNNYLVLKDNLELAFDVYNTIQLQYKSGIKTYLEVISAETDLRTARINYTNAMYSLLSSKIDVQKALGQLKY
ncbi:MAG TPA: TolC family protein [Chitinophagaceae bacterium]|nr:TolC family protein [Chitinophagaceae bacterium]